MFKRDKFILNNANKKSDFFKSKISSCSNYDILKVLITLKNCKKLLFTPVFKLFATV